MQINYPAWSFWRDIVVIACAGGSTIYTWWSNREKVNAKRFGRLEDEVKERVTNAALEAIEKDREIRCERHRSRTGSIEGELQKLNAEINHLPTSDDIGRMYDRVNAVAKEMDQAVGELKATRRQIDLVLEELLRRDKR